eukprot:1042299-Amphidinium_carterae.1
MNKQKNQKKNPQVLLGLAGEVSASHLFEGLSGAWTALEASNFSKLALLRLFSFDEKDDFPRMSIVERVFDRNAFPSWQGYEGQNKPLMGYPS